MVKEEGNLLVNKVGYCIAVNKKIGLLVNFSDFKLDFRRVEKNK